MALPFAADRLLQSCPFIVQLDYLRWVCRERGVVAVDTVLDMVVWGRTDGFQVYRGFWRGGRGLNGSF
jgi:hypothetical protein